MFQENNLHAELAKPIDAAKSQLQTEVIASPDWIQNPDHHPFQNPDYGQETVPGYQTTDNAKKRKVINTKNLQGKHAKPRGRIPKGKKWNSEMGMWEDDVDFSDGGAGTMGGMPAESMSSFAPEVCPQPASSTKAHKSPGRPRGRPPKGKVWDTKQGCWVAGSGEDIEKPRVLEKLPGAGVSLGKKPRGRPPKGKMWDSAAEMWVDDPTSQEGSLSMPSSLYPPKPNILPPGWAVAVDPNSKNTYYYHETYRQPQWEPPFWPGSQQSMAPQSHLSEFTQMAPQTYSHLPASQPSQSASNNTAVSSEGISTGQGYHDSGMASGQISQTTNAALGQI